jgi:hypothetical protein
MNSSAQNGDRREMARSWAIVLGIALSFLAWGLLIFFTVGDKGPPGWDFSVVEDIPGQSVYSTHEAKPFVPGTTYEPQPGVPVPGQHVAGPEDEETRALGMQGKGNAKP